jgi:hypothetical protein
MQDQGSTDTVVDGVVWGRPVSRGGLVRVGALRAGGEDSGGLGGGDVATTAIFVVKGGGPPGRRTRRRAWPDEEEAGVLGHWHCGWGHRRFVVGAQDGTERRGEEQDLRPRPSSCLLL